MKTLNTYTIQITDTFGGEANYCWARHYLVKAKNERGAINKLARHYGAGWRNAGGGRYDLHGACVCLFIEEVDLDGWCDLGNVHYEKID